MIKGFTRIFGANRNYDKSFVCLPRQDLMPKRGMAEISHLWADWYLIYTPFTLFKVNYPMN